VKLVSSRYLYIPFIKKSTQILSIHRKQIHYYQKKEHTLEGNGGKMDKTVPLMKLIHKINSRGNYFSDPTLLGSVDANGAMLHIVVFQQTLEVGPTHVYVALVA
jgi:hypothetical protein